MWRRGPSKQTPANVQCQKCLKRDKSTPCPCLQRYGATDLFLRHYSYECKAAAQERPYVSRPSRTQQLFNPKLTPKLTEAAPPPLESKKGVADQELAKREAERAKKRELDRADDAFEEREGPKRRRSASYDSVSTISTSGSPRPASRQPRSPSPKRGPIRDRSDSPPNRRGQRYSRDVSHTRGNSRNSRSVDRSVSPARDARASRFGQEAARSERSFAARRSRRDSRSLSRSPQPADERRFRSRSPDTRRSHHGSLPRYNDGHGHGAGRPRDPPPPPAREQRERSLSPFSKRLALTQSMNMGR